MENNLEKLEKEKTRNFLNNALIPIDWLGYKCVVTAIPIIIDSICSDQKIVLKELYKVIAKYHKTTASKVECAIRYIHENTAINKYLKCNKLSNKTLLYEIAKCVMVSLHIE